MTASTVPARVLPFALVTLAVVLAAQLVSWMWIGPFLGLVVALPMLAFAYRSLAARIYPDGSSAGMLAIVCWWVVAACSMLGGATTGFLAAARASSAQQPYAAPWSAVGWGTIAGALVSAILVAIIRMVVRLSRERAAGTG